MEMGGNFCQILELGGTTIKGRRVTDSCNEIIQVGCYFYLDWKMSVKIE